MAAACTHTRIHACTRTFIHHGPYTTISYPLHHILTPLTPHSHTLYTTFSCRLVSVNELAVDESTSRQDFVTQVLPELKKRPCVLSFSRPGLDVGSEDWAKLKGLRWPLEKHSLTLETEHNTDSDSDYAAGQTLELDAMKKWRCCDCDNPFSQYCRAKGCQEKEVRRAWDDGVTDGGGGHAGHRT
jgi:hypothetical protein